MRSLLIVSFVLTLFRFISFGQGTSTDRVVTWKVSITELKENVVELNFAASIAPNWTMYSQFTEGTMPMTFSLDASENFSAEGEFLELTKPKNHYEEVFEATTVFFENKANFKQKIKRKSDKAFKVTGLIEYQVCIDGKCKLEEYEIAVEIGKSEKKNNSSLIEDVKATHEIENTVNNSIVYDTLTFDSSSSNAGHNFTLTDHSIDSISVLSSQYPNDEISTQIAENDSFWLLFILSFLAGLAAILTPCVFPMIPMTVTFFMHSGESKAKARSKAFFFGISIILIYTIIGTIIAVTLGANFANWLSTHWIPNVLFFLIFIIFAASFLGMFEITMPGWMINKADKQADKGGYSGAFFMAFTLVLVSFSCTGPIVGAILVKSAGGQVLEPIIGMLGFSLAFALPFSLFAIFPSWLSNLPKSGGWLNSVKVILGFLELALGLKFLSIADQTYHWGILDREVYLAIWIVIFTLMGLYLLGKLKLSHDSELKHVSVPRLTMAIVTFSFVVYLIPGMFGAPLKFLSGYLPPMHNHDFDLTSHIRAISYNGNTTNNESVCEKPKYGDLLHLPHGLKGYFDYEQALKCSKEINKPIFIDFTGHGCVNCRQMESNVWSDPQVLKRLHENFIVLALYVDDKTEMPESEWILPDEKNGLTRPIKTIGKKYAQIQISRFGVNAQPYYILLDFDQELLTAPKAYDLNVDAFVEFLDKGIAEFNRKHP